ncbi:hypothetical protein [Paracidobacterium acidisoli]|uniref:Choice-of-anchor D domain-containing protein n=1 Tax=Paracidobacterium acidisoli TaxID=2303751 RepID=A0A372IRL1_9BACT|nr:hypothetical protein [Paracidobacterium acidisoli]MBT9330276.1 hypothetical protein [Paracidobacterium acidisoli]
MSARCLCILLLSGLIAPLAGADTPDNVSVVPDHLNFPAAGSGAPVQSQTFTLINTSGHRYTMNLAAPKQPFTAATETLCANPLPSGQHCAVTITYQPTTSGTDNATLEIRLQDADDATAKQYTVDIALTGGGLSSPGGSAAATPALSLPLLEGATKIDATGQEGKEYAVLAGCAPVQPAVECTPRVLATGTVPKGGTITFDISSNTLRKSQTIWLTAFPLSADVQKGTPGKALLNSAVVQPKIKMPVGEQTRLILGYEQGGASGADGEGRLFLDFYSNRAIPDTHGFRWIGNVRIGSSAQTQTATLGDFVAGLASEENSLKLNAVASVAEFLTGLEYPLNRGYARQYADQSTPEMERFSFAAFAIAGASGYLSSNELNQTFAFPADTSQAYQLLVQMDKNQKYATTTPTTIGQICVNPDASTNKVKNVSDSCDFAEFHKTADRFDREAYGGIKLTTHYLDSYGKWQYSPPALVAFGIGVDEAVKTNTHFGVARVEGFLPVPLPISSGSHSSSAISALYVFGTANIAIHHGKNASPNTFIGLNTSDSVKTADGATINPSANNTYVIQVRSVSRDLYSIGVGIDLVSALRGGLLGKLFGSGGGGN